MKKFFLIIVALLSSHCLYSQKNFDSDFSEIVDLFNQTEYYKAIEKMDVFIHNYPGVSDMYYNRGLAKYILNDMDAAKEDLLKAQKLGFKEKSEFIKWVTSTPYKVKTLIQPYMGDVVLDPDNGYKPHYGRKDSLQGALREERTCYDVFFYELTLKVIPKSKSIAGSNVIWFSTTRETSRIQIDLLDSYKIGSIIFEGKKLKYSREYNAVFIDFLEPLDAGKNYALEIKYEGKPIEAPNPPWEGGFVWKKNKGNWWVGVACEHLGASSWWPCKDHLSDKPDSMRINIQVPDGYQAVSNGNLLSTTGIGKGYSNFEWFVSYPINSYCVTMYVGKFVNFNEIYSGKYGSCNIDYYVMEQNLDTAKKYYSQTKEIVEIYENLYGPYPYTKDGLAMVEAPYSGMENQSAIAIGDEYGKKQRRRYETFDYDYLLVHETAHEWWGNSVTMADMADAWISESFATYSEQLFTEAKYGYDAYLQIAASCMQEIENIWPMVGLRDVNDNTFPGSDIYYKGAVMLHNLRCLINDDSLFFDLIKGFNSTYAYQPIATQDFIDYVNQYTGKDYSDFFNKFLYDAEPPVLQYSFSLQNDSLSFTYKWINVNANFVMPFGIYMNDSISIRLVGTTEDQTFGVSSVSAFYIPNEKRFEKNKFERNSFTYFWTMWKRD